MSARPKQRLLVLGAPYGWHADQLRQAAHRMGHVIEAAPWETVSGTLAVSGKDCGLHAAAQPISLQEHPSEPAKAVQFTDYDAVLTRTMPVGSLEQVTFRLAALHALADGLADRCPLIVNPPRSLEWAIDKFATQARLSAAGCPTPATRVVQTRSEAMQAFDQLGGDCVVKPIFGGEGRGVMRVTDRQLAWTCFSTLEQLDKVILVQAFVPPGGSDLRLLVIGERVLAVRRHNANDFRSNASAGAKTQAVEIDSAMRELALQVTRRFKLTFAAVDLIDQHNGPPLVLEVNSIPGWKATQAVYQPSIADWIIETLVEAERTENHE